MLFANGEDHVLPTAMIRKMSETLDESKYVNTTTITAVNNSPQHHAA